MTYKVKDKEALLPIGFAPKFLKGERYFKTRALAKEYMVLNYLLDKQPGTIAQYYDYIPANDDDASKQKASYDNFMVLTVPSREGDIKRNKTPHYVLTEVSPTVLIIYSCDDMGRGKTDKSHHRAIKKMRMGHLQKN